MRGGCVPIPGAFNGLVAHAVRDAGFSACYVSGGAISAASGVPDIGLLGLAEFCAVIRQVSMSSGLPVIADADTGFGEAEMVRKTVMEYHRAGASALHLEDQVFPKRCGHLDGKTLVPSEHMAEKITWAAEASRDCSGGEFIVCARTDARGVEGFSSAVERARIYLDAGADMIFPEGLASLDEFRRFADELRSGRSDRPLLLANMTEFGKTPMIPLNDFERAGYDCVIYPVSTLRLAMKAVTDALGVLREQGTLEPKLGDMQSRDELYKTLRYDPAIPWQQPS
ncbi:MAG: isocitrate lyase/phosphoenolpyruvate mutase family protein [Planctomycetota bacterium]